MRVLLEYSSASDRRCTAAFQRLNQPVQLRSVGEDRRVVEYDLPSSFVSTGAPTALPAPRATVLSHSAHCTRQIVLSESACYGRMQWR